MSTLIRDAICTRDRIGTRPREFEIRQISEAHKDPLTRAAHEPKSRRMHMLDIPMDFLPYGGRSAAGEYSRGPVSPLFCLFFSSQTP